METFLFINITEISVKAMITLFQGKDEQWKSSAQQQPSQQQQQMQMQTQPPALLPHPNQDQDMRFQGNLVGKKCKSHMRTYWHCLYTIHCLYVVQ